MKLLKFNQKGITHLLAPLLFVIIFAGIGGIVLMKTKAATTVTTGEGGGIAPFSCTAQPSPTRVAWNQPFIVTLKIKNNLNVALSPKQTKRDIVYTKKGSHVFKTTSRTYPAIAAKTTVSYVHGYRFIKPWTKEKISFAISSSKGSKLSPAAHCSATVKYNGKTVSPTTTITVPTSAEGSGGSGPAIFE